MAAMYFEQSKFIAFPGRFAFENVGNIIKADLMTLIA